MAGQKTNKTFLIILLGMLSAIGPFSIDMYLPGFPAIAADLNTSVAHISLSLSSFFIGISAGQFIYGPLLDRYGRKKPLYFGLLLYIAASFGCANAASADALIYMRVIQALGGCAGMVAARAIIRDVFRTDEIAKVFSKLMLVIAISPIIAPTLGGYLIAAYGWQMVFIVLAVMALLILICIYFALPESMLPGTASSLKPRHVYSNYIRVLQTAQFNTYAFTGAVAAAGLYAYISGAPFVFITLYGVSEKTFGWIFAVIALGLITASQINSFLLKKYSSPQIIKATLFFQMLTGIGLYLGFRFNLLNVYSSIFLIFIFISCQGFIFPNTSALSMAPFKTNAGSASAMMGGIQMTAGALSTFSVSMFSNSTALPMAAVMALCSGLSVLILYSGNNFLCKKNKIWNKKKPFTE